MADIPLIKQFLQHQSQFMAYLVAITRDVSAAEEIFQNAAVVVMEKSAEEGEVIRDFRPWAKEIVRRQALSYMQKQVRAERKVRPVEPSLLEQITRSFIEDQTTGTVAQFEVSALRQCIAQLQSPERSLLQQRFIDRMSFATIAESVGKTDGAVQRAISRIRKRLAACIHDKLKLGEVL